MHNSHILGQARKEKVDVVTLHVQTNNDAALRLYEKNGFTVVETKEGYYKDRFHRAFFLIVGEVDMDEFTIKRFYK